jgi:hypothetical protein
MNVWVAIEQSESFIINNSVEQSHSLEADSHSASQEIPRLL